MRMKVVAGILMLCCLPGFALGKDENVSFPAKDQKEKAFLPVYIQYVKVVREQGAEGLKGIVTPDFTFRWAKHSLTGQKALTELNKYAGDLKDGEFAVKVRRLTIRGNKAIAMTQETATFTLEKSAHASMTWYWKQTWRKTSQGWKLVVSEKGAEKIKEGSPQFTFTSRP